MAAADEFHTYSGQKENAAAKRDGILVFEVEVA